MQLFAYLCFQNTTRFNTLVLVTFNFDQGDKMGIKTGPKRTNQDGTPDKRQRVTEENKKKHPKLKEHKHEKGD